MCFHRLFSVGHSDPKYVICGVPQVSILVFTALYIAEKSVGIIMHHLSVDLNHLADWFQENELILNLKKAKLRPCYLTRPNGSR